MGVLGACRVRWKQWNLTRREERRRRQAPPHQGIAALGLKPTQVYPFGDRFYEACLEEIRTSFQNLHLTPQTPIVSLGSCFAEEFAHHMRHKGYHYLSLEPGRGFASANWGRVYTVPNWRQILAYSLQPGTIPTLLAHTERRSGKDPRAGWFDPLRDQSTLFDSETEALADLQSHREASRKAFEQAELLVFTLGQNEAWLDRSNNLYWAQRPPSDLLKNEPERFVFHRFSLDQVVEDLRTALSFLAQANPRQKVLLTLSPVPAFATFHDQGVISASMAHKCLLRTAIESVRQEDPERIYYYPSFEMVLAYNPWTYKADNRHVLPRCLRHIFRNLDAGLGL